MNKDAKVSVDKGIKEIIIVNEDDTQSIIKKGLIIEHETLEGGEEGMSMRFANLTMNEAEKILNRIILLGS